MNANVLVSLVLLSATTAAIGSDGAKSVAHGVDVVQEWRADQHLYVKGRLSVPADRLAALERWLDKNAPNWTVLLAENADGERFDFGASYSGMDAIEHALGQGLTSATGFADLKHPQTGQANGVWFAMYLRERKMAYHASQAYDARNLGEQRWRGNLDAPAIRAMRSGGRIEDAVIDTVTSIDGELQRRITAAADSAQREQLVRRRMEWEAAAVIDEARQRLEYAKARTDELQKTWPDASGDLISPPFASWRAGIEEAAAHAAAGRTEEAGPSAARVTEAMAEHLERLGAHATGMEKFGSFQTRLDNAKMHEFSAAAQDHLAMARTRLQSAREAHARADSSWVKKLGGAEEILRAAYSSDERTRQQVSGLEDLASRAASLQLQSNSADAQQMVSRARQRVEEARGRLREGADIVTYLQHIGADLSGAQNGDTAALRSAEQRRMMAITGGGVAGGAALLFGFIGNRRRRKVRARATDLLTTWETTLQRRTDDLLTLLDRTGRAIGSADVLARSGWSGETLRLARQTIADVDQLFVMSSAVDGIFEQARALIRPGNPVTAAQNLVSGARYERALGLLEEDRIAFGHDSQVRDILSGKPVSEWRGLLGRKEDCEPFALSFAELNDAFTERAARAVQSLDSIEGAWLRIQDALGELDRMLDAADAEESKIGTAAKADGLFAAAPVFDALLPSARKDHADAEKLAANDPVQALAGPIAAGRRKVTDAAALCDAIVQTRADVLPAVRETCGELERAGRLTRWADEAATALSERATELASAALEREIASDITAWSADSATWRQRAETCRDQQQRAAGSVQSRIDALETRIRSERERLAAELAIAAERVLCEEGMNPSGRLAAAREQSAAVLAALDRGDTSGADDALGACENHCADGERLVADTAAAAAGFAAARETLIQTSAGVRTRVAPQAALLAELVRKWSPAALRPAAADAAFPDPQESVADNITAAEQHLASAERHTADALTHQKSGRILAAAAALESGRRETAHAAAGLDQISAQAVQIQSVVSDNRTALDALTARGATLTREATEPQSMRPTQQAMAEISLALERSATHAAATGVLADPFALRRDLAVVADSMDRVQAMLQSDRTLHAGAVQSLQAAEQNLASARPLVRQAGADAIPDSPAMAQQIDVLDRLQRRLATAMAILAEPHSDWKALDAEADTIAAEAAAASAGLRGELDAARRAVEALQTAAARVHDAGAWWGSHGVAIGGSTGTSALQTARRALAEGEYTGAQRHAAAARREAESAIEAAEAEVRRRQREEERRREEARRQAAAQRAATAASAFSSSSHSSGRSSHGGSGIGSASSHSARSSFSSGSGSARSGW